MTCLKCGSSLLWLAALVLFAASGFLSTCLKVKVLKKCRWVLRRPLLWDIQELNCEQFFFSFSFFLHFFFFLRSYRKMSRRTCLHTCFLQFGALLRYNKQRVTWHQHVMAALCSNQPKCQKMLENACKCQHSHTCAWISAGNACRSWVRKEIT